MSSRDIIVERLFYKSFSLSSVGTNFFEPARVFRAGVAKLPRSMSQRVEKRLCIESEGENGEHRNERSFSVPPVLDTPSSRISRIFRGFFGIFQSRGSGDKLCVISWRPYDLEICQTYRWT